MKEKKVTRTITEESLIDWLINDFTRKVFCFNLKIHVGTYVFGEFNPTERDIVKSVSGGQKCVNEVGIEAVHGQKRAVGIRRVQVVNLGKNEWTCWKFSPFCTRKTSQKHWMCSRIR